MKSVEVCRCPYSSNQFNVQYNCKDFNNNFTEFL